MDLARKRLAKRSRMSSKKEEDTGTDGRGDDADGADDDMQDFIADNPFAKSLPEGDLAFALSSIPAGMALDDEENDEGLDEIAKAAAVLDDVGKVDVPRREAFPSTSAASSHRHRHVPPRVSTSASGASSSGLPEHLRDPPHPPLAAPSEAPPPPLSSPGDALAMVVADEHVAVPDVGFVAGGDLAPLLCMPNLDDAEAPGGSNLRLYPDAHGEGKLRWQAKLPPGSPPFEGTKSKSMSFPAEESGALAKFVCHSYLQRWHAAKLAESSGSA